MDVDELGDVAEECQVSGMPTFALFREGKMVRSFAGAKEAELEQMIANGA